MPTDPSPETRQDAPGAGRWPDEVESLTATEHFSRRDDGTIRRGVELAWVRRSSSFAARGWVAYFRQLGPDDADEGWTRCGEATADATSLLVLDRFALMVRYEFVVVPVGATCCAQRPPAACHVRARLRLLGDVVPAPAPEGLALVSLGSGVLLRWEPVDVPGIPLYEVRVGSERFDLADVVGRTTLCEIALPDLPPLAHVSGPALTFHVAALCATGVPGSVGKLRAQAVLWGPAEDVGGAVLSAPAWSGTKDGAVVADDWLVLDDGETEATYTTDTLDAGAVRSWRLFALVVARRENEVLTPALRQFPRGSYWGRRRSAAGRDAEAYPQDPVPRRGPLSPNDSLGSISENPTLSPNTFAEPRPDDAPVLTANEKRFAASSAAGRSYSPAHGIASTAETGYAIDVRFSDDGVAWTEWGPYARQVRTFRYVAARVTLRQPAPAMKLSLEDVCLVVVRATPKAVTDATTALAALGTPVENETPAGTINGVNDTFTLAHAPLGPVQLFRNGLLQLLGTDYTISGGTSVVYQPGSIPEPGDWHRVWYRR